MKKPDRKSPQGLWLENNMMEASAASVISQQLSPFTSAVRDCYEAGVEVATLPAKGTTKAHMLVAALFLKKSLNDFRATWVLLHFGYTSQAAAVAGSLYENALSTCAIAGDMRWNSRIADNQCGDIQWSPQELAKLLAERIRKESNNAGVKYTEEEYQLTWRQIYGGYKWLCKIKHPTYRSAAHDAGSASVKKGKYVIMAAPDIRTEDLPTKSTIISIGIGRLHDAIQSFALGRDCNTSGRAYLDFSGRMKRVLDEAKQAYLSIANQPLPFTIGDSQLAMDCAKLRAQQKIAKDQ
jgi:hypothetical protein